jgi:acyl-CoA reductase-like NAD-dependent aldehyde dehydrogenase
MTIKTINPITEEVIQEFEENTFEEIDLALENSKLAQKEWTSKTKEERVSIMQNMKKSFEENQKELIETVHEECGINKDEVQDVIYDIFDGFEYYIEKYSKLENINFPISQEVFPESTSTIQFYPHGVIAQIGVWNYPLWQTMISAIPALLTGNSIIYKPSEKSTKVGLLISKAINSTKDFPKDLFIPIIGDSKQGKYLVKSNVNAVIYTGNIKTGNEIIKNSGTKPKILELSGNDAAIVCKDCDMNQAIEGIAGGAFFHSGQVCDRIKRIYVVKEIADEFIEKLVSRILVIRDKITPLISADSLETVDNQIKQTVEDGAEILTGGKRFDKKGFYYEPTLLKLKHNDVYSVQNEIFGPVASLLIVDSEEEAINFSNSTEFGLGTSIWTQDFEKANKIANQCETGMIWINDSNIPLICGEYFQGWKSTSIPNSSDRLSMFIKSKTIISFNSKNRRAWWY